MNNGCVCCTVRGDLINILTKLSKRKSKFDAIIIETTGLADPGPGESLTMPTCCPRLAHVSPTPRPRPRSMPLPWHSTSCAHAQLHKPFSSTTT